GVPLRLTGQDTERGTFSQRHLVLHDANTGRAWAPIQKLPGALAPMELHNSPLSELATLGFEYGYSAAAPEVLVLWEAQFGDFINGAQVIVDQFLAAGLSKWGLTSRLTLLLPHGYEGQGPEHSSARLERFLQLGAEDNLQVANITTPANYFHALRRQMKRDFRKPLVIMSPKSLLRHPAAVSKIDEFTTGHFQEIIDDPSRPAKATRLILCSGKVYYDLADYRAKHKITDAAIVRVEQLYPLHRDRLAEIARAYGPKAKLVWCQEEPENMGAYRWIAPQLEEIFGRKAAYAGRDAAASPAVGALAVHKLELAAFLKDAFSL
ncbi:MAG TPA: 2-oxoglutarate dehydrogenase E1 component, partial [Opitutaceae bacterium]